LLLGCVGGGDTSDAATIGSLGGPCFANNTCNANLVCVLVSGKGVCQESDAGGGDATVDQSVDQSVADTSTSDATSEASDACAQLTPARACTQGCSGGTSICCEQLGQCSSTAGACGNSAAWPCQTKGDCTNMFCCADGITLNSGQTCPPIAQMLTTSQASCFGSCPSNSYSMCLSNADCPQNTPNCVGVLFTQINKPLGICM
jgi:hypothetical protein